MYHINSAFPPAFGTAHQDGPADIQMELYFSSVFHGPPHVANLGTLTLGFLLICASIFQGC